MSNEVKRISKYSDASTAVNNMINDMQYMWDGFKCDGVIIPDQKWGAKVKVSIPMESDPESFCYAQIFRNGDEYICIVDFYIGEDSAFQGTQGNWYTVDDCYNLIPA
jgi:hypothetical protein